MSEEEACYVCKKEFRENDELLHFGKGARSITIHKQCLSLFAELVKASLQLAQPTESILSQPDFSMLPSIRRESVSESDAIIEVLRWAAEYHPMGGLTPNEIETIFREQFRWQISNASARLGGLLERGRVRRIREGKAYRYFIVNEE